MIKKPEDVKVLNMSREQLIEHIFVCHNDLRSLRENCVSYYEVEQIFKSCVHEFWNQKRSRFEEKPEEWWKYHHPDCGTKYRGCHPTKCPKNQYEKLGIWKLEW